MEGRGPYRIYDPGGSNPRMNDGANDLTYQELLKENAGLRERMKGLKSLGNLLEESQTEASKLRQRVEALVRDNEVLRSSSFTSSSPSTQLPLQAGIQGDCAYSLPLQGILDKGQKPPVPQEDTDLATQLQRQESSLSVFAEESNKNQLFSHLGRMALEFNRLSVKVQKNEQKTAILQTLCEQLRLENEDLCKKVDADVQYRNQDLDQLRRENQELKKLVTSREEKKEGPQCGTNLELLGKQELVGVRMEAAITQQSDKAVQKAQPKSQDFEMYEKKIRALEQQRGELVDVNKQWDEHFRSMKQQYEQKLVDVNKQWDQHFRSMKQQYEQKADKERLKTEVTELKQKTKYMQDQLVPLSKQREYQEKEIHRLNRALEEALKLHSATAPQAPLFGNHGDDGTNLRRQELLTQIAVLKEQADKERLKTEVTELKQKTKYMQDQLVPLSKQREYQEKEIHRLNRALEEALKLHSATAPQAPLFGNHGDDGMNLRRQELLTQIAVLKEQVKIFEEDFQKERSDRERMNEEKEELRQKLERLQSQVTVLNNQADKERLKTEGTELKQKTKYMQDQLVPLSKQREYQEKEIHRLNRALEEALKLHSATAPQAPLFGNHGDDSMNLRRQELLTQIAVLKEQVKIFEEDFQKERSDRERMNEEKDELRQKLERLQSQVTGLNNQLRQTQSDCQRERAERDKLERLHRHLKQGQHERRASDHTSGAVNLPAGPPYPNPFVQPIHHPVHQGYEDWPIHYPPRTAPSEPARDFQQFQPVLNHLA
ncbi:UNVERIFIED_CONTAM: hypothetical protein FKN15_057043 [Acipenser sinensis]